MTAFKICNSCGKQRNNRGAKYFCSNACRGSNQKNSLRRLIGQNGYIIVSCPSHPKASKCGNYVYEHVLVAEKFLERHLKNNEIIHHKDGNKLNNDISNLEITTKESHTSQHMKEFWKNIPEIKKKNLIEKRSKTFKKNFWRNADERKHKMS